MKKTMGRLLRRVCAVLICLASLVGCLAGCSGNLAWTIEAGGPLPNAVKVMGLDLAQYVEGFENNRINHAGTYSVPIVDENGRTHKVLLTVVDHTKPVVTPCHVYYALGMPLPEAEDFIGRIVEVDTYTAEFVDPLPALERLGDYDVSFRVKDASGNQTGVLHSVVTVIRDTESPVFTVVPELSAYKGEAIAYRRGVVVTDNCCGDIRIDVDSSSVLPEVVGEYPVRYTATDASGNTAHAETIIHIYESQITEAMLNKRIDSVIASMLTPTMDNEAKLRMIYKYIQSTISYTSDSDKSDWIRAAYDSLFVSGSGDCFNYFAAAKAFLRRLGLDYREIQRTPGAAEGTHYWLMVNLGDDANPRWYHYDCTRMIDGFDHSLLTDKQLNAYNRMRPGFFAYDASKYPATSSEIITKTPVLERFY